MKIETDFLCDLWMKLSQLSNHEDIEDEECTALVSIMDEVEIALLLKLQDEVPNAFKILAVLTNFGDSELSPSFDPWLKAYSSDLDKALCH
ncbi:hypothetical protein X471_01140 [Bartonella bacilliformis str. Heidi Mejia]|uniref:hypothetical protein n=1 Tax=Bartonella bacilliformis TaxID=774 RepID=UPI000451FCAE|nr:hypothetical protein [Bartonella bacilliformis]EYS91005.1 hypothetical protein X471_01140 [Bartonella bacilliformis str. Heidi Mejia]KEG16374.1 hypothetical protein H705_00238 [Bartonella bacilliformis Cond044]KEG17881.1 hypothetical protein H707_01050 [Bartonella bacilliformis Hosp800-02]KEG21802.1 hypothetical protein H708_01055 [Bartonella bacilliformis VAB9028]KEG22402.1 hypothetical protein H706_01252 [Bartonella bacilliformis CAR600-02]